jgi:hypothetical protein
MLQSLCWRHTKNDTLQFHGKEHSCITLSDCCQPVRLKEKTDYYSRRKRSECCS